MKSRRFKMPAGIPEIKAFGCTFDVKADGAGRTFEGYAATWDLDNGDDQIHKGAFVRTIHEGLPARKIKVLYQHDRWTPIGMPTMMEEDSNGLHVVAELAKTPKADETLELMRVGALSALSIGFMPVHYEMEERDNGKRSIRHLHELALFEFSPVTFPMNENAVITSVKAALGLGSISDPAVERLIEMLVKSGETFDLEAKGPTRFTDLPLADRDYAWDAAKADKRVRDWAGAEEGPNAKYAKAFLWFDDDAPENFGSYKLGFADVIDGKLVAVPKGIFACAGVLMGARGGVDIPEADILKCKAHVEKYYRKMANEWDDDDVVAPWKKEAEQQPEIKAEALPAVNIAKVQEAIAALAEVRDVVDSTTITLEELIDAATSPPPVGTEEEADQGKALGFDPAIVQSIKAAFGLD